MPIEPPPSRWALPEPPFDPEGLEVVGLGADLAPGTLLAAYRKGLFPMRLEAGGPLAWWSPDPRGILPLDGLRVSRSLQRSCRRYRTTVDEAFGEVVRGCADPSRPHGWIDDEFVAAYTELHRLGWAHSIEVWDDRGVLDDDGHDEPALVGGLYGVAIGGAFAAESKFHRANDASKVAVVALVELLRAGGGALLDVQWTTEHLASLGAVDVSRDEYGRRLVASLALPLPRIFTERSGSLRAMTDETDETSTEALRVYHNPVCSKSRGALEILADRGVDVDVVEYLRERPTRADLERILAAIPDEPAALVRKDKRFKELELDPADYQSDEQVVTLLLDHPELMERPVVFRGDRALICRPSERVLELLD